MNTRKLLTSILLITVSMGYAQTFTMGKKCREALANAQATLADKSYQDALALYQAFAGDCKTKDAKEQAAIGMAEAYNGLGMHQEAIAQADAALKVTKDRSLDRIVVGRISQMTAALTDTSRKPWPSVSWGMSKAPKTSSLR